MEDRPTDDLAEVEAILRGDRDAFAELVRKYQTLVAGVAWRYGIRRDDIEDVVSEVMIKVYRNLHQYRPDYPFSTWLYRLAANHILDHSRRSRRESRRVEMPAQVADDGPGPAEGIEGKERRALVQSALSEIDSRYREAIFLVYVEGRKVDEAARILGVPEGTVKTRLMRGREALRKILIRRHPEHFGA